MITHYEATAPIIVICPDDDVDVDEARNLMRDAVPEQYIPAGGEWEIGWLSIYLDRELEMQSDFSSAAPWNTDYGKANAFTRYTYTKVVQACALHMVRVYGTYLYC